MRVRHPTHPDQIPGMDTDQLRAHYLVEQLFPADEVAAVYTHQDRMVVAGTAPAPGRAVSLPSFDPLRSSYFCERRELGVVNVGAAGTVTVDGETFRLGPRDGLYVGRGARDVLFASDADGPESAAFYLVSTPAHVERPHGVVRYAETEGTELGANDGSNRRTLRKYIHADGIESSQLVMGVTSLATGSMWNTMPCHTHDRRTEVYLYFDLPTDQRVVHLLGKPDETRHLLVSNRQAVISPSWSIHCGFGTHNYAFVWAMGGENQAFDDMDHVAIPELR